MKSNIEMAEMHNMKYYSDPARLGVMLMGNVRGQKVRGAAVGRGHGLEPVHARHPPYLLVGHPE